MNKLLPIIFLCIVVIAVVYLFQKQATPQSQNQNQTNTTTHQAVLGKQTKTANCQANGPLPDSACTPGAINNSLTKDVLCSPDFSTKSVRNVPAAEKRNVYDEYTIASHKPGAYEVDHLISLELGGSNDISNLWPEAAEPRPGFHEKDLVENYLHRQVCDGKMPLADAQHAIASNWLQIFQSVPDIQNYR